MIECVSTKNGAKKMIPKEKLFFRPGAYAVILNNDKVLLITAKSSNQYFFPGGGIELGETNETALKREVKEESGLKIKIERFLHFKEQFIYYNHWDKASHSFSFFYLCKPLSFGLTSAENIIDDDVKRSQWVELSSLDKNKCGGSVVEILQLLNVI
jgi:ADP-ribose pyrophosphatase YjhB (NUDIX family)